MTPQHITTVLQGYHAWCSVNNSTLSAGYTDSHDLLDALSVITQEEETIITEDGQHIRRCEETDIDTAAWDLYSTALVHWVCSLFSTYDAETIREHGLSYDVVEPYIRIAL
jgi:hypothetical protein